MLSYFFKSLPGINILVNFINAVPPDQCGVSPDNLTQRAGPEFSSLGNTKQVRH